MNVQLVQPGLFGDDVERARIRKRIQKQLKKISGKQQFQYSLKIRTRAKPRVIDFKPRLIESTGNDCHWDVDAIVRLHVELIRDWEERFPSCPEREQVSYWLWMLGNRHDAFSFWTCLVCTGFTHPDAVIDAIYERRPGWYRDIEGIADDEDVANRIKRQLTH